MPDGILRLLLSIVVVAVIIWVILAFVPLPYPFGMLIVAVGVIACLIYAVRALGGSAP